MSKGISGLFKGTRGMRAAAGSALLMDSSDMFAKYIANRKDIDPKGFFDVIAHGEKSKIEIYNNGIKIKVSHRVLARLLKSNPDYAKQPIRLLSCETGKDPSGFAQNLANKLGVPVKAPTEILWAYPNGAHLVAGQDINSRHGGPNLLKPGRFKTFYPKKGK